MSRMRIAVVAASLLSLTLTTTLVCAQSLLPKTTVQHATVTATPLSSAVRPGSVVTLSAVVTPNPSIHIYAEGARDFTPVSLVTTPNPSITPSKPRYPKPEAALSPGLTDGVPAYTRAFRIELPVTLRNSAKTGDVVSIAGAVNYQACDDRLCYPVTSAPVTWTVMVQ